MDDSERSYGYSNDIYHGTRGVGGHHPKHEDNNDGSSVPGTPHSEKSYEYGPEDDPGADDLSPEEEAMHVVEGLTTPPGTGGDTAGSYDYDRRGSAEVDSFTWNVDTPPENADE
jgi:hypothetical protein